MWLGLPRHSATFRMDGQWRPAVGSTRNSGHCQEVPDEEFRERMEDASIYGQS